MPRPAQQALYERRPKGACDPGYAVRGWIQSRAVSRLIPRDRRIRPGAPPQGPPRARGLPAFAAAGLLCALAVPGCSRVPPARYDTLAVLGERDVDGLDPHTARMLWHNQTVIANIYEGLVRLDSGMRIEPALAVEWFNSDDVTLELKLRPGVFFHDGSPLAPADVVFSIERARTHPRSTRRSALSEVVAVEMEGPDRVRMRMRRPDATFVAKLGEISIVSRRCAQAAGETGLEQVSCGTGAYRLAGRTPGTAVDLARFDRYWGGRPDIPKVRFLAHAYGDPALERHLGPTTRLVFYALPDTPLFERAKKEAVLHQGSGLGVSYLAFDLHGPESAGVTHPDGSHRNPFHDRRTREAIALAIDHDDLNRRVENGRAIVATQLISGAVFGFDREAPRPKPDLARARRLLAETPFREGFEVELDVRAMMGRFGAPLGGYLAALGLRPRVTVREEDDFFAHARPGRSSLYVLRFSCRTGDAQELLDRWVHSKVPDLGLGSANFSYEEGPVAGLDAEIRAARHELNPANRLRLLRRLMQRVNEERLAIPLLQEHDSTFVSPEVEWQPRADTFRIIRTARFRR